MKHVIEEMIISITTNSGNFLHKLGIQPSANTRIRNLRIFVEWRYFYTAAVIAANDAHSDEKCVLEILLAQIQRSW